MERTEHIETITYRILLFRDAGRELFVLPHSTHFTLPALTIPRFERAAENLTTSLRREYSQNAVCLFGLEPAKIGSEIRYHVMESTDPSSNSACDGRWVSVTSVDGYAFEESSDLQAVEKALEQCQQNALHGNAPFARFGWFRELTEWASAEVRRVRLTFKGCWQQFNASPTFSLIRFETDGPAVWFKAVGEPNLREYPVTLTLAEHFSPFTPRVLAARNDWHGWLTLETEGKHPSAHSDVEVWVTIAKSLAELQLASVGQSLHLRNAGCRDARFCALLPLVEPFFETMSDLMERQVKESPAPLSRQELRDLQTQLQDLFAEAAHSAIPTTLGHLDFNAGNILVRHNRCVFLDWAEACVGEPFLTFQYLLELHRRLCPQDDSCEEALTFAHLHKLRPLVSPGEARRALQLSPILAAFAYAVCGEAWRDPCIAQQSRKAAYLRGLTRRMKREADLLLIPAPRSVSCLP
jgi:hypothetical protein